MSDKIEFLYKALDDIQGTIRAIDVKISFILAIVLAPLAVSPTIIDSIIILKGDCWFVVPLILSLILWGTALYLCLKALSSVGNPADKVFFGNLHKPSGLFFSGYLFAGTFNWKSLILNSSGLSKETFEKQLGHYSSIDVEKELVFEQMKLCYIREIKMYRQFWIFRVVTVWGTLSLITLSRFILR